MESGKKFHVAEDTFTICYVVQVTKHGAGAYGWHEGLVEGVVVVCVLVVVTEYRRGPSCVV